MSETADAADLPALLAIWAGKEGSQHTLPGLRTRMSAVRQLGALAQAGQTAALEGLVAALTDEDIDVTNLAAFFFRSFRAEIILPLLKLVVSSNSQIQTNAFKVLAGIPNLTPLLAPETSDLLVLLANNQLRRPGTSPVERWWPVGLLGALSDPIALELLLQRLADTEEASTVRHAAITAIKRHWWRRPSQEILEALLVSLKKGGLDFDLLVQCLEEIKDPWLARQVYALAEELQAEVKPSYYNSLLQNWEIELGDTIGERSPYFNYYSSHNYWEEVDSPAIQALLKQKKDECISITIEQAVHNLDQKLPTNLSYHLLFQLNTLVVKPILSYLSNDRNSLHRKFFLKILTGVTWDSVTSLVNDGLESSDLALCRVATELLATRTTGDREIVLNALQDSSRSARQRKTIAFTLAKLNIRQAIPILTSLVETEPDSNLHREFKRVLEKFPARKPIREFVG